MNTAKNILITPGSLGGFNTTISQIDFKWYESGVGTGIAYPHGADLRATVYNWVSGTEPVLLFGGVGAINGQSYFVGPYLDYTDVFTGINTFPSIQLFPISGKIIAKSFGLTSSFYDSNNSVGLAGSVLSSLGTGVVWAALPPFSGGGGNISGSFSTNQVLYGVGTDVGGSNNLWFTGNRLGIGTNNPTQTLDINGTVIFRGIVYDINSFSGLSGQVLTSLNYGVAWSSLSQIGVLTGFGNSNVIPKYGFGGSSLVNSSISDNGTLVTITEGLNVIGIITSLTFYGFGTYITNLNASNLFSGTVPSSVVSGTYSGISSVGTLTTLNVTGITSLNNIYQKGIVFDSYNRAGFANSIMISTGVGISWTSILDIGQPSSGGFTSGLLTITPVTTIPDAVNNINQILALIAPSQANALTGNNLGNVGVGLTVKLPSYSSVGVSTSWYAGGATSGSTVSGYITNGVYNVFNTTVLSTGGFKAGFASQISSYGQLSHKIYNYTYPSAYLLDTIDMTLHYVPTYTSGTLSLTAFGIYNSIWNKADATITYTQTNEGWEAHTLYHTLAGESNQAVYYFDTYSQSNPNPTFSVTPTATVVGLGTTKYLSGISYFAFGSQFLMNWTAASGIFNRAYNATNVGLVTQIGMNNQGFNPSSVPNYTDTFPVVNGIVTLNAANQATMNKWLNINLYKASGLSTNLPASISSAICTYGIVSTQSTDQFFDEAQRLVLNTGIGWTSSILLTNGNAQVRNGTLQYPNAADYPSVTFSGAQQYQRWIYKSNASLGTITLTGLTYSNISPYGTGNINVLIYLDTDQIYFDLAILFGTSGKTGATPATAYGGQNSGSSGTTVAYNLGTYNTVNNNSRFRLIIIFNNSTYSITNLTSG